MIIFRAATKNAQSFRFLLHSTPTNNRAFVFVILTLVKEIVVIVTPFHISARINQKHHHMRYFHANYAVFSRKKRAVWFSVPSVLDKRDDPVFSTLIAHHMRYIHAKKELSGFQCLRY